MGKLIQLKFLRITLLHSTLFNFQKFSKILVSWFQLCHHLHATSRWQQNHSYYGTQVTYSHWTTVCKMVRPMLSDRCLSVLSVCDSGVLWPNSL